MGASKKNHYWIRHYSDTTGDREGLSWRYHYGTDQVDTTSSEVGASEWADLETAASVSFAAFDSEAGSLWGSAWTGLPVGVRGVLHARLLSP